MKGEPISISQVTTKAALKAFIKFPIDLYKGNSYYVPPIIDFELSTLDSKKNPAFEHCLASYWVAKKEGRIVGRIAGIIVNKELKEHKKARFGWIDFIDDQDVSYALLETVANWAKQYEATTIHGPMGFTDLDFEGALTQGFDQIATQATIYNYPYYIDHYNNYGFEKAVDWIEYRGSVPAKVPQRLERIASLVKSRFNLNVLQFKKDNEIKAYAYEVIELLNKTYNHLYGYYELSDAQIRYYVKLYFGFIRREYVNIITNENGKIVAMAISMPSMSLAFQKANGSLLPFGFIRVLKDFYSNQDLDLFLVAVDPEYQKLGTSSIIFHELLSSYIQKNVKTFSTGPMLEENFGVQNLWGDYQSMITTRLRRRCFIKPII
jgi:hypothetical protein